MTVTVKSPVIHLSRDALITYCGITLQDNWSNCRWDIDDGKGRALANCDACILLSMEAGPPLRQEDTYDLEGTSAYLAWMKTQYR